MKLLIGSLIIGIIIFSGCPDNPPQNGLATPLEIHGGPYEKLEIQGTPNLEDIYNGIYDPSIEYNEDGSVGYLAYTVVYGKRTFDDIHIAKTTDNGKTWNYIQTAYKAEPTTITESNGTVLNGSWSYEVASLVHDPTDSGKEWKLFAHKQFQLSENQPLLTQNTPPKYFSITIKTASDPSEEWSEETVLFGAGNSPVAPATPKKYNLNEFSLELQQIAAYSEPGGFEKDGILYLTLSGLSQEGPVKVFLLSSKDHAESWEYVGVLVDKEDARALGVGSLDGSALFEVNGKIYLSTVVLKHPEDLSVNFFGTYIFEVEDLATAKVLRRLDGKLRILKFIKPMDLNSGNHGSGQADYDVHNTYGGIVFPQINLDEAPEIAQVFNTKVFIE